jgi:fructoselysine 6-kinase
MAAFDIATVGDNCVDRFLPTGQAMIGGNALNVAVQLARLGCRVAYFGAVGDDAAGRQTLEQLERHGVVIDHVTVCRGPTAFTDLDVDATGDRIIRYEFFGPCAGYRPTAAQEAVLKTLKHVHFGWFDDGGALKAALVGAGVSVSQDLAVNPGATGLAVGFASEPGTRAAALDRLAAVRQEGAHVAIVTRGAAGSMADDGTGLVETGTRAVEVVDTTGAGDSFAAAFIEARLRGLRLADCLAAGRDHAALACVHFGGFPQEPFRF